MELNKEFLLKNIQKGKLSRKFTKENNTSLQECYDIINPKEDICTYCNKNKLPFISFSKGYKPNCPSCSQKRREETNLKKYGSKNVSGNKEIQQKKLDTVIKNYGKSFNELMNENSYNEDGVYKNQTKEAREKREKTLLEKYNTTDVLNINNGREKGLYKCNNSVEVKEKREKSNTKKYGGVTPFYSKKVQNKVKQTMLERYGFTNIMFSKDFVENEFAKACLERDIKRLEDIDENGLDSFQRVTKDRLEDIDENGLNSYQRVTKDRLENIDENGLNSYQRVTKDRLENIDENGLNSYQRVTKDRLEDIDENGLNSYQRAGIKGNEKRRTTNEANGNWITEDLVKDFKDYSRLVWRYTNQNDLTVLENIKKRGHANKGMYHLDHKYSIFQGYMDNISAKTIGCIYNLEMIIGRNNLTKGRKCAFTLDEIKDIECQIN